MSHAAVDSLLDLASALGINLGGMADDVLEVIALRIVAEDLLPTKPNIERIVAEVKRAEGSGSVAPAPVPSAHRKPAYMKTKAAMRETERLGTVHRIEDARAALNIRPRRPQLPATKAHPPCVAAAADGGVPCSRCSWLLDVPSGADVAYIDAWLDRDDDTAGRL